ncbi:MAG TPA: mechanosensitive ion channel domain-containing protein [Nitrososphaerales archaeon]|nr:mechanosensitive ion channel domain-containing protein [Nitrososphaerales archaeon]
MLWLQVLLQIANTTSTTTTAQGAGSLVTTIAELVVTLGIIVVVGSLLTRFIVRIAHRAGASKQTDSSIRDLMGVIVLLAALGVVSTVSGLSSYFTALTITGVAGLAASLALQTTLSNIISGILMLRDGIVHVGDDIQYGGPGGLRGEVIRLSLRTTWLRTSDGHIAVIGNSNLSSGPILNHSATARLEKKVSH